MRLFATGDGWLDLSKGVVTLGWCKYETAKADDGWVVWFEVRTWRQAMGTMESCRGMGVSSTKERFKEARPLLIASTASLESPGPRSPSAFCYG